MDIALFSPSSLFADEDDSSAGEETGEKDQSFVDRSHQFPGMELLIREFSFHQLNANLLWPGTFSFADWLVEHPSWLQHQRIIELGSGTGALAIFLRKSFGVDITTSDFDDEEIEKNIAHNCRVNGIIPALPHIRHTWGDAFPSTDPDWDLVIASDILLYVKQYPNLIKTLSFLLKSYKPKDEQAIPRIQDNQPGIDRRLHWPAFLMSWRRRIGKEDEALFFNGCEDAGLVVEHVGSRVYCISLRESSTMELQIASKADVQMGHQ
ncbi:PREDICTED: protein N-methyltransferase NNT1 isoform X1 [Nelumbo nucifera]|uniref:Protein N-methyltransferase NNT1 isoform X1 n=1 Tax=Nelumbo nucifera TaxID=4432 RepID=A0A1U8A6I7_NELNU|nr:PREDICTED: protein N-methyltransferase NNT1 isoform X1 [Nelumbo nucifera]